MYMWHNNSGNLEANGFFCDVDVQHLWRCAHL